jgi:hypothetical protein
MKTSCEFLKINNSVIDLQQVDYVYERRRKLIIGFFNGTEIKIKVLFCDFWDLIIKYFGDSITVR